MANKQSQYGIESIRELNNNELLGLYGSYVRHNTYCPIECNCFFGYNEIYSHQDVIEEILLRMDRNE